MKITVHRGSNQIGGCVTEYEYEGWKLFVDYGKQLPGDHRETIKLDIEGLTHGDISRSALLITHYHGDHVGSIAELPQELPVYIGQMSRDILSVLTSHLSRVDEEQKALNSRLQTVRTFVPGEELVFGEFKVTPLLIDHSAFDSYAFLIEANGLKVFHTGDFRTHGFRSKALPKVIDKFVGRVDYMVCEATNVKRPEASCKSERDLQKEFEVTFKENKYNVVYLSATNIDRIFSLYHAALRANRPFIIDDIQDRILRAVAGRDKVWGKSALYRFKENHEPLVLMRNKGGYLATDKFNEYLADKGYVLIARSGDKFDALLSKIPATERKTYLSMWRGYVNPDFFAYNPAIAKSIGNDFRYLHTSGHCNMVGLENLIGMLHPKAIIPIHTDAPEAFADLFCEKWPVLLLKDGESFSPIKDPGYDNLTGNLLAVKELDSHIKITSNPKNLPCWSLDEHVIGEFQCEEDALRALKHTVYAPGRLLAYSIEECEDMSPWSVKVYNPDFILSSEYSYGGHQPGGDRFHQPDVYKTGDRVLAFYYYGFDVVVPCEIVGPVTEDFLKKEFDAEEIKIVDDFDEYKKTLTDWEWDSMIVRPLVRLENEHEKLPEEIAVERVMLFPLRE